MKTRRLSVTPVVLALLVGVLGGAVCAGAPALANTIVIPISGTIEGFPESVELSGSAEITSTLAPAVDDPAAVPNVILHIKFLNVTGPGESGKFYVAPGENLLLRNLRASDVLELYFPFHPSGSGGHLKPRTARVVFTITFDTATGAITGATTGGLTNP